MKKFLDEFKNFAVKGNMVDLAIGILVGTAFNRVIDALVGKVLMPPLALLSNGVELANLKYVLRKGSEEVDDHFFGVLAGRQALGEFPDRTEVEQTMEIVDATAVVEVFGE